jgi:hypothetical protein
MAQARDRIRTLQQEAGRSQGPICESFATDSSDSSSGDGPYRPFWQDARNFFLGANPVFRKPYLRGGRASATLSRSNAGILISK